MVTFRMVEEMALGYKFFPMVNIITDILKRICFLIKAFIIGMKDNTFLANLNLDKKYGVDYKAK